MEGLGENAEVTNKIYYVNVAVYKVNSTQTRCSFSKSYQFFKTYIQ